MQNSHLPSRRILTVLSKFFLSIRSNLSIFAFRLAASLSIPSSVFDGAQPMMAKGGVWPRKLGGKEKIEARLTCMRSLRCKGDILTGCEGRVVCGLESERNSRE
jgi:hypothetical protein